MKAKYIFTKYGHRRNDLEISAIVPENDPDYDVADVFLTDYYSDDGECTAIEAENLEEAVYFANRYFHTCVSPKNIKLSYECYEKLFDIAFVLNDPYLIKMTKWNVYGQEAIYVPAPIKIDTKWGTYCNKRYRKFYQKHKKSCSYGPDSLAIDYGSNYYRV